MNDSDADVSNDDDVRLFLKNIEHSLAIDNNLDNLDKIKVTQKITFFAKAKL